MSSPGNYLLWVSVTHYVPKVGFASSLFFGVILLFLNCFRTQNVFGSYKHLISAFTILGIFFAGMEIIVYPNVHNYKSGLLFFSFKESFGLSGPETKNIPLAGYTFFHSAIMALLSVQFIYRYWAVFDTAKLAYFTGHKVLIWVFYCAFFGFQYAIGSIFFLELDEVSTEYFREEMLLRYDSNMTDFPAMAILAYDPVNDTVRWRNVMGIVNVLMIANTQYGVMIYCGWSMYTQMEEKLTNLSSAMKRHHRQFFKTLVVQLSAPTVILFLPLSCMIILPLFDLDFSFPSGVFLTSFTLYPATDSIIVMYFVSEYRKTAIKIWKTLEAVWKELKKIKNENATTEAERND